MGARAIDDTTKLVRSTQSRTGTPNGNVHFNLTTGELEIITRDELATVTIGGNSVPNPLTLDDKPTLRAIYELQQKERETDETFRRHRPFLVGRFKLGRAFDFIYGRTLGNDRQKVAGSGWREFGGKRGTKLNRIYFNASTLKSILDSSQVSRQLEADGAVVNFSRTGAVDEALQVFGTTAHGDSSAGDFDKRTYLAVSVSTYGQRHGRVVLSDFGVNELEGYGQLAALGESPHPTTGKYPIADVIGAQQKAPFTTIKLDILSSAQTVSGFNESNGAFSKVIRNPNNATLEQVIAWIDANKNEDKNIAQTGTWNGKRKEQLYVFDANGKPTFIHGVFIENLPESDKQKLNIFDDAGNAKTFPFNPEVRVALPSAAVGTNTGWYQAWVKDGSGNQDYDKADAVTLQDATGTEVKGLIGTKTSISFGVPYDTFSQAGLTGGNDFVVVFTISSRGEFEEETIEIPITRSSVIPASISTVAENNI